MAFNKGDAVQLKIPEQGRRFKGIIGKITEYEVQVNLPNGLYVVRPKNFWELIDEKGSVENDQARK